MSAREWKPGDVAMVTFDNATGDESYRGVRRVEHKIALVATHKDELWFIFGASSRVAVADDCVMEARPHVRIDPEDRGAVERLNRELDAQRIADPVGTVFGHTVEATQAALREFANPKQLKPEEPQNDGAVVEDALGRRWIRTSPIVSSHLNDWVCSASSTHSGSDRRHWDGISVVRVLSEGVQP